MKKILICGDSFAANTNTSKFNQVQDGWPSLLEKDYEILNIAECGVGEYKILKQVQSVNMSDFDLVIVCHTSPNRVHIKEHPIHSKSVTHKNCDLILTDLESNNQNVITETGLNYFKYIFDHGYYMDIFNLIKKEIALICNQSTVINISFFDEIDVDINFFETFKNHRGCINHLSDFGNIFVYTTIREKLSQLTAK